MAAVSASISKPAELNITSYRNDSIDDFEVTILDKDTGTPIDLSIYDDVVLQVKNDAESPTPVIEFTKLSGSILWSVDESGSQTGNGSDGKIVLRKTMTEAQLIGAGKYVYDIEFINTTQAKRNTLVYGNWTVTADRTR